MKKGLIINNTKDATLEVFIEEKKAHPPSSLLFFAVFMKILEQNFTTWLLVGTALVMMLDNLGHAFESDSKAPFDNKMEDDRKTN